jgi:hypothetical protein
MNGLEMKFVWILLAGFAGLIGKIIWDWLQNLRGKDAISCKGCTCLSRIENGEKMRVGFEKDIEHLEKRLTANEAMWATIRDSVQKIQIDISKLVGILEERGK